MLAKQREEGVKDVTGLLQQLAIVAQCFAQAVDDGIETRRFESSKLFVLQINVVNYFREILQAANVSWAKTLTHGLEGAVVALVRKLRAEHVEGNRAGEPKTAPSQDPVWFRVELTCRYNVMRSVTSVTLSGKLIDSEQRLAFVACEENSNLVVFDLDAKKATATISVVADPDVLAFDNILRRLYVSAESGVITIFDERDRGLTKVAQEFLAPNGA